MLQNAHLETFLISKCVCVCASPFIVLHAVHNKYLHRHWWRKKELTWILASSHFYEEFDSCFDCGVLPYLTVQLLLCNVYKVFSETPFYNENLVTSTRFFSYVHATSKSSKELSSRMICSTSKDVYEQCGICCHFKNAVKCKATQTQRVICIEPITQKSKMPLERPAVYNLSTLPRYMGHCPIGRCVCQRSIYKCNTYQLKFSLLRALWFVYIFFDLFLRSFRSMTVCARIFTFKFIDSVNKFLT